MQLRIRWSPWALSLRKIGSASRRGPGGKRGRIKSFSAASRRRLRSFLASLDFSGLGKGIFWVTLTARPEDNERFFSIFRDLKKHFTKRFPACGLVWRLEIQRRGVVHFHCLVFGPRPAAEWLRNEWLRRWGGEAEKVAQCIRVCRSIAGIAAYISDMGKIRQEFLGEGHRHWGYVGSLPFYALLSFYSARGFVYLRRLIRRLAVARLRRYRGRRPRLRRWFCTEFLNLPLEHLCLSL